MVITVYQYPNCSTCRKALVWLDDGGIEYQSINLIENTPDPATLKQIMNAAGVPIRKLFNTSGKSYRAGDFKNRLATMTEDEALAALAADGMLIKRPLLMYEGGALIGFREQAWAEALG